MSKRRLLEYVRHADRFGTELVFETAAGVGEPRPNLTITELVTLARSLTQLDPRFDPARPDKLVELAGANVERAYRGRIAPVLDALRAPRPTSAGRACEICGKPIAGRADRRTCTTKCRRALSRAGGAGPFARPTVTFTDTHDVTVEPRPGVTPTSRKYSGFSDRNGGVRKSREVPAGAVR